MCDLDCLTEEEMEGEMELLYEQNLVKETDDADDLAYILICGCYQETRNAAAAKLIKMWKEGRRGRVIMFYQGCRLQNGVTLEHLTYVGDHAKEPHKSEANQIIRDNL